MKERSWLVYMVSVYLAFFINAFFLLRMVYLALASFIYPSSYRFFSPVYLCVFVVFVIYQLMNLQVLRVHYKSISYPSKRFCNWQDFLMIINSAFLAFYAYETVRFLTNPYLGWNEQPILIRVILILFETGAFLSIIAGVITVLQSAAFRKYLKTRATEYREDLVNSIGKPSPDASV